jgi:ribonucleotide reductase alpha subunit
MKIIVSDEKMINLVGNLIKGFFPNFNKENAEVMKWINATEPYIEYYDPIIQGFRGLFAEYYFAGRELALNRELYNTLKNFFGEDKKYILEKYVLNWFNKEFKQKAEQLTYRRY